MEGPINLKCSWFQKLDLSRNEIRLLELQPAKDIADPVVCRLVTTSLDDAPEFIAISSLYGDLEVTERIKINGANVSVTLNLGQALRHTRAVFQPWPTPDHHDGKPQGLMRRRSGWLSRLYHPLLPTERGKRTPLRLWVDAICINRLDNQESAQSKVVMYMAYTSARAVVSWLGMKDETTDLGIQAFREIDAAIPPAWGEPEDREQHPENYAPYHQWMTKMQYMWTTEDNQISTKTPYYEACSRIMLRPYFQREWILEEVSAARYPSFLIGDSIVPWRHLLRAMAVREELYEEKSNVYPQEKEFSAVREMIPLGAIHSLFRGFERRRKQMEQDGWEQGLSLTTLASLSSSTGSHFSHSS